MCCAMRSKVHAEKVQDGQLETHQAPHHLKLSIVPASVPTGRETSSSDTVAVLFPHPCSANLSTTVLGAFAVAPVDDPVAHPDGFVSRECALAVQHDDRFTFVALCVLLWRRVVPLVGRELYGVNVQGLRRMRCDSPASGDAASEAVVVLPHSGTTCRRARRHFRRLRSARFNGNSSADDALHHRTDFASSFGTTSRRAAFTLRELQM